MNPPSDFEQKRRLASASVYIMCKWVSEQESVCNSEWVCYQIISIHFISYVSSSVCQREGERCVLKCVCKSECGKRERESFFISFYFHLNHTFIGFFLNFDWQAKQTNGFARMLCFSRVRFLSQFVPHFAECVSNWPNVRASSQRVQGQNSLLSLFHFFCSSSFQHWASDLLSHNAGYAFPHWMKYRQQWNRSDTHSHVCLNRMLFFARCKQRQLRFNTVNGFNSDSQWNYTCIFMTKFMNLLV